MDRVSKKQRSKNMTAVKSRGNKSTELRFMQILKENKVTGWRRHYKRLEGTPDFVFPSKHIAVFIDGCFWHGCPCSSLPKTNVKFWKKKIALNRAHDKSINSSLRLAGWKVLRLWEHDLKKTTTVMAKLNKLLTRI